MATTLLTTATKSVVGHDSPVTRAIQDLPNAYTNVSSTERWASLGLGGVLTALGLRGVLPTPLALAASGYMFYRAATGNCIAYQAVGFSTSDTTAEQTAVAATHGSRVDVSIIVMKPAAEAYDFWRDFENLPRFMTHLLEVNTSVGGRSQWIAQGPFGLRVEWEAEIVNEKPGEVIAWRSLPGADVDNAGSVHFRELPQGRGTEVKVSLKYDPPAGQVGSLVAKLVGKSPDAQIRADLRHFKQILETGETATVDGQAHGER